MDELIAFFAARLDELVLMADAVVEGIPDVFVGDLTREQVLAMAVLADVATDRKLLHQHAIANALLPGQYKLGCCEALDDVVKMRAARFDSHPDYRTEWAS